MGKYKLKMRAERSNETSVPEDSSVLERDVSADGLSTFRRLLSSSSESGSAELL